MPARSLPTAAVRGLPSAPAPSQGSRPPALRVLLVAPDDLPAGPALDQLMEWVWRSPRGVVVLAPTSMVEPLRERGVTVETLVARPDGAPHVRLDFAGYFCQKIRLLRTAYNCGPVLFWGGDARDDRQAALLRNFD